MKRLLSPVLCVLAGVGIGGAAVQTLHAQAKPPVYVVTEITVTNPQAYGKEYAPKVQAIIKASGGEIIALGGSAGAGAGTVKGLEGTPPKRVAIQKWDSMDKLMAWWDSKEYKEVRRIGNKYAKFRVFTVDGRAQ
jgi:uncharacterized protein (DUF1330 family)